MPEDNEARSAYVCLIAATAPATTSVSRARTKALFEAEVQSKDDE